MPYNNLEKSKEAIILSIFKYTLPLSTILIIEYVNVYNFRIAVDNN